jgi:uncharacterized membrane protein
LSAPIFLAFLIGAVLGMRFKVLILIPAIGLVWIVILAAGIARDDNVSAILIAAVLASSFLQIGYLCGTATRYSIALARIGRTRKGSLHAQSAR